MKIYFYFVITVGLMILLNMAGIQVPSNFIINSMNIFDLQNFTTSAFFVALLIILTISASFILIGSFTRTPPESSLITGFVSGTLILLIGDVVSIYIHIKSLGVDWAANLSLLILAPFIVGYSISLLEFWRGTD